VQEAGPLLDERSSGGKQFEHLILFAPSSKRTYHRCHATRPYSQLFFPQKRRKNSLLSPSPADSPLLPLPTSSLSSLLPPPKSGVTLLASSRSTRMNAVKSWSTTSPLPLLPPTHRSSTFRLRAHRNLSSALRRGHGRRWYTGEEGTLSGGTRFSPTSCTLRAVHSRRTWAAKRCRRT
jgi:hypothetical protein